MVQTTTTNLYNNVLGDGTGQLTFKSFGTVTLDGATPVTITDAEYVSGDKVDFALKTVGGTVGDLPTVKTTTTGAPTVAGTASDTSVYNYWIYTVAAPQTA